MLREAANFSLTCVAGGLEESRDLKETPLEHALLLPLYSLSNALYLSMGWSDMVEVRVRVRRVRVSISCLKECLIVYPFCPRLIPSHGL